MSELIAKASIKTKMRRESGVIACAICRWTPPEEMPDMIHLHHIVPSCVGGSNYESNLIALCPNHHALVHALFPTRRRRYDGPRTREGIVQAIRDWALHRYRRTFTEWLMTQTKRNDPVGDFARDTEWIIADQTKKGYQGPKWSDPPRWGKLLPWAGWCDGARRAAVEAYAEWRKEG